MSLPLYEKAASPQDAAVIVNSLSLRHDEHAYLIGRHLGDQRKVLGYKLYGTWLKENIRRFTDRTARAYRTYAERCLAEGNLIPFSSAVREDIKAVEDLRNPEDSSALAETSSPNFEFHTPPRFIEAARRVMGGIDLDPASCDEANDRDGVRIPIIFTLETGRENPTLQRPWSRPDGKPSRIWLNPPYGQGLPQRFCDYLMTEHGAGRVSQAIVLPSLMMIPEIWLQNFVAGTSICLLAKQIKDWSGSDAQVSAGPRGNVIIGVGVDHDRFAAEFGRFGAVGLMGPTWAVEKEVAA